jgi:peroxiredoxin
MTAARRLLLPALLLVVIAVLGLALVRPQNAGAPASTSGQAVRVSVRQLDGAPLNVEAYRGKIVVVNFLAAWCTPCWDELGGFERVSREYRVRGVQVVGIGVQSTPADIRRMIDQLGLTFPVGLDGDGRAAQGFGLSAMPTTVFLDREGRLVRSVPGKLSEARLRAYLLELL